MVIFLGTLITKKMYSLNPMGNMTNLPGHSGWISWEKLLL